MRWGNVSPRRVATTRPPTHPPRVGGGGGSTPRPSATLASPAAPSQRPSGRPRAYKITLARLLRRGCRTHIKGEGRKRYLVTSAFCGDRTTPRSAIVRNHAARRLPGLTLCVWPRSEQILRRPVSLGSKMSPQSRTRRYGSTSSAAPQRRGWWVLPTCCSTR